MSFQITEMRPDQPIPRWPGKTCGPCTVCCYTVPVMIDDKPLTHPFERCRFLHAPFALDIGCTIYQNRPRPCQQWSCSWLSSDLPDEFRPDRCGFVIDPVPDVLKLNGVEVPAAQIWVVAGHENDWQDVDGPLATAIYDIARRVGLTVLIRWKRGDQIMGRAFRYEEETGKLGHSPETVCGPEVTPDEERAQRRRAQALMQRR